jgi:hypothetical protein
MKLLPAVKLLEHFEQDLINRWESGSETLEFAGSEAICHARSCASKGVTEETQGRTGMQKGT